jgi:hypothetical protein
MKNVNQLKLSATLTDPGTITVLPTNGDHAINFKIEFAFGSKQCQMFGTAYQDMADRISKIPPGSNVVIDGALYTEPFKTKSGGSNIITKIRANDVYKQDNVDEQDCKRKNYF